MVKKCLMLLSIALWSGVVLVGKACQLYGSSMSLQNIHATYQAMQYHNPERHDVNLHCPEGN
jgi:hypothetical protein